jgi:phospholipid/cholesterol/gamma-HCH transport system permease protein
MSALRSSTSWLWPLRVAAFAARVVAAAWPWPPLKDTVLLAVALLMRSLPVVVVVTFFAGAMLTVQAAVSLEAFGARSVSGLIVGFGGVREVFPLLAGGSLAARTGAEIASHLQTMRVSRQVEALEMMGIESLRLLVVPRVVACLVGGPLCVLAAMVSGLAGAYIIGVLQLGIDRGAMWGALMQAVGSVDVVIGVIKGTCLGGLVGVVATFEGMTGHLAGPQSVGAAANRAVIRGMVVVCAAALGLSMLIYGRIIGTAI